LRNIPVIVFNAECEMLALCGRSVSPLKILNWSRRGRDTEWWADEVCSVTNSMFLCITCLVSLAVTLRAVFTQYSCVADCIYAVLHCYVND